MRGMAAWVLVLGYILAFLGVASLLALTHVGTIVVAVGLVGWFIISGFAFSWAFERFI